MIVIFLFLASFYKAWFASATETLVNGTRPSRGSYSLNLATTPKEAYQRELILVNIPERFTGANNFSFWIAVTAVDEHGLESSISNLVFVRYSAEIARALSADICNEGTVIKCFSDVFLFVIIGGVILVIIIVILIGALIGSSRNKSSTSK